jgi:hypothetical protein
MIQSQSEIHLRKRSKRVIGFLAQEVARTIPESVSELEDGWMVADYTTILPIFVEAIKKHAKSQEGLAEKAAELDQLTASLAELTGELKMHSKQLRDMSNSRQTSKTPLWSLRNLFSGKTGRICLFLAPLIFVCALAIILGFVLGLPIMPPPAMEPIRPKNYINDGGFENPDLFKETWSGTASLQEFRTSIDPPGYLLLSTAPFDAGSYFLLLNGSRATVDSTTQRIAVPTSGFQVLQGSIWMFLPRLFGSPSFAGIELSTVRNFTTSTASVCTSSAYANLTLIGGWQRVSVEMPCVANPATDYFTVSIVAGGSSLVAAADNVEVFPANEISSVSPVSFEVENLVTAPRSPNGQQATQVLQHRQSGYALGIVELANNDFEADIGVARVYSYGRRDYGWGDYGGLASLQKLKQTNATIQADWIAADNLDRVYVVGRSRLGSSHWVPAAARLNALDGSIDTTFGAPSGMVPIFTNASMGKFDAARSVIPYPDGRVFVVASVQSGERFAVACLTSFGKMNTSFASPSGYFLVAASNGSLSAATVDIFGRTLVASTQLDSIEISRYLPDGSVDLTYGSGGIVLGIASGPMTPSIRKFSSLPVRSTG